MKAPEKITSLYSTTKVPLLLLDHPTPSQPHQQAKQRRYPSVWLLLKMQKRGGVAWDSDNLHCPLQIWVLLSLEKSVLCSRVRSFMAGRHIGVSICAQPEKLFVPSVLLCCLFLCLVHHHAAPQCSLWFIVILIIS